MRLFREMLRPQATGGAQGGQGDMQGAVVEGWGNKCWDAVQAGKLCGDKIDYPLENGGL